MSENSELSEFMMIDEQIQMVRNGNSEKAELVRIQKRQRATILPDELEPVRANGSF
jgi:hypothetical protein